MKKKVLFPLMALVLALSLALPMALMVGAQPPESDTIYGITNTGKIYEIDPIGETETKVAEVDKCPISTVGPNGLAYDQVTNRIYYTEYPDTNDPDLSGKPDYKTSLYFINLSTGEETFAGLLDGEIACADIYQGHYYYIAGGANLGYTDDLYKVELLSNGMIGTITTYPGISGTRKSAWGFNGDIAIQDGVIYADGRCYNRGAQEIFQVNCDGSDFKYIRDATGEPQLAFGLDGQLYAHLFTHTAIPRYTGTVDWTGGSNPPLFDFYWQCTNSYTDLASAFTGEPNEIEVSIDIKPGSCPNPLSGGGVLPVAILGTEDFDVNQIDPDTVELEGVAPLRWSFEDVATPFIGGSDPMDCMDCTTQRGDGYLDMTLKFDKKAIIEAVITNYEGPFEFKDCQELVLTGELFDGTPFTGKDVVRIQFKVNSPGGSANRGGNHR